MAKVQAGSSNRVHFSEDVAEPCHAEIALEYVSRDRVDIHLGFLKLNHRYHITFTVKDDLGDKIIADKNENIAIHESGPNAEGHKLVIDFKAYKEHLLEEMVDVYSARDKRKSISLVFHARVLGHGQGTPALRHGIQCIYAGQKTDLSNPSLEASGEASS